MIALGNTLKIKPQPREKKIGNIYLPETALLPNMEWGVVTQGCEEIPTDTRVLYMGLKCFEQDGEKLVPIRKVILWE